MCVCVCVNTNVQYDSDPARRLGKWSHTCTLLHTYRYFRASD